MMKNIIMCVGSWMPLDRLRVATVYLLGTSLLCFSFVSGLPEQAFCLETDARPPMESQPVLVAGIDRSFDNQPSKNKHTGIKASMSDGLNLELCGTATGTNINFVVIEDKIEGQQKLLEVGDTIQGATITKILAHSVILTHNGKDEVFKMRTIHFAKSEYTEDMEEFDYVARWNDMAESLGPVMKQMDIRPHFNQGEPDGITTYGIRPGSVLRKMGLRDGDIVRNVNGKQIFDEDDIFHLSSAVSEIKNGVVILTRQGKEKKIEYRIKDGDFYLKN